MSDTGLNGDALILIDIASRAWPQAKVAALKISRRLPISPRAKIFRQDEFVAGESTT
jgi:hypothetical protein